MHRFFVPILALAVLGLPSCASRTPQPGHALIEYDEGFNPPDRIRNVRFVSMNGKSFSRPRSHLNLTPGPQKIEVSYKFPGTSEMITMINFEAHEGRSYEVRFDPHPVFRSQKELAPQGLASREMGDWGMIALPFELIGKIGTMNMHNVGGNHAKIDWAYLDVISDKLDEGLVFRIKVPE